MNIQCTKTSVISTTAGLIVIAFWLTIAHYGYERSGQISVATSLDSNTDAAKRGLDVFNDNFLHRAGHLNPMPTVAIVSLKVDTRRDVVGPELREFSKRIEPLDKCVSKKMKCTFNNQYDLDFSNVPCEDACKIPGAICGASVMSPLFGTPQAGLYNTIDSLEGYFEAKDKYGETIARERYISKDNRSAIVILKGSVPKCSNQIVYYPLTDWLRKQMTEIFNQDEFEFGLTSWSELMRATKEGSLRDGLMAHIFTLPLAWAILALTVGPTAIFVIVVMPVSMLATVYLLVPMEEKYGGWYTYAHIAPGMWVSILIAMCIDYLLFILSRWKEEKLQGNSKEAAIFRSIETAGKTVILSGVILAMSFFALMMIDTPIVQEVGASCGVLILVTMVVNVTLTPALLAVTPDMKWCYVKNKYVAAVQKRLSDCCISRLRSLPHCQSLVRSCLASHTDGNMDAVNIATYRRLEMKSMPAIYSSHLLDSHAKIEGIEGAKEEPCLDESLEIIGRSIRRQKPRTQRTSSISFTKGRRRYSLDSNNPPLESQPTDSMLNEDFLQPPNVENEDSKSGSSSQVGEEDEPEELGPNVRNKRSDTTDSLDPFSRIRPSRTTSSGDRESYLVPGLRSIGDADNPEDEDRQNVLTIPSNSIWVKIAKICRERPLTVILTIVLLGAPLSIQCYRFKLSSNFEQLFLRNSKPISTLHQIRNADFYQGVLNRHYMVVTLGSPIAMGKNAPWRFEPYSPRDSEDSDTDGNAKHINLNSVHKPYRNVNCVAGSGYKGRRKCFQPKCWMDDPDGILKSYNKTCPQVMKKFEKAIYESSVKSKYETAEDNAERWAQAKKFACTYDPNVDNPAYPDGFSAAYLCPQYCNDTCHSTLSPTAIITMSPNTTDDAMLPSSPTSKPTTFIPPFADFESLFECGDDKANWLSKVTPCFVLPDGFTFWCSRPGPLNCAIAGQALGRKCHTHKIGASVGAGGQYRSDTGQRSITWGDLCPSTCNYCPYAQRIFTKEIFGNLTMVHRHLKNLKTYMGEKSVNTINVVNGRSIPFTKAIEMMRASKPRDIDSNPDSEALEYRDNVKIYKSLMGSACVIELTPKWNPVGAKTGDWVEEVRNLIPVLESEAQEQGLKWEIYFEGLGPILADMKASMYNSAPGYMLTAIIVVVLVLTSLAFKSLTMGFRLLITVAFSLSWVFGIMVVLLQDIKICESEGDGMHFLVPIITVPVLVGLTLDYDLFLLVRIHEYRMMGFSSQDATMAAMYSTSGKEKENLRPLTHSLPLLLPHIHIKHILINYCYVKIW
ncbi:hypothetical protein AAMO2058_000274600 [Amorphochlora amoebiformis]